MGSTTVKIRYENKLADVVAFNRYHCDNSPTIRRMRLMVTWIIPLVVVSIGGLIALGQETYVPILPAAAFAIIYVFISRSTFRNSTDRCVRKMYKEGSNNTIFCDHELELDRDYLIERTEQSESKMKVNAIEKVISDGDRTYVYVNAIMAHVIPRDSVRAGDYDQFVEELRRRAPTNLQ